MWLYTWMRIPFAEIGVNIVFLPKHVAICQILMISMHAGQFDDVLDNESSKSPEDSSKGIQLT